MAKREYKQINFPVLSASNICAAMHPCGTKQVVSRMKIRLVSVEIRQSGGILVTLAVIPMKYGARNRKLGINDNSRNYQSQTSISVSLT